MFEHGRSAARGPMSTRGLCALKHQSELGRAHAHSLSDRLQVASKPGLATARRFDDYAARFVGRSLAAGDAVSAGPGVELIRRW